MSVNTRKQRSYLYNQTFMNWKVEQRLSELQRSTIETSLTINKFGNDASENNFNKFCESLSDLETMIEVAEDTFPALRARMDSIKKGKLTVLKKQTAANKHESKAKALKNEALNIKNIIEKQTTDIEKSKGLKKLFK